MDGVVMVLGITSSPPPMARMTKVHSLCHKLDIADTMNLLVVERKRAINLWPSFSGLI